jgi:hypothetical protein
VRALGRQLFSEFSETVAQLDAMLAVHALLTERPGWRFERPTDHMNDVPLWAYGRMGESRIVVTASTAGEAVACITEEDHHQLHGGEHRFADATELAGWLRDPEDRYAGITALARELLDALPPEERSKFDDR